MAVLKELEYNDSVKQSDLFSPPNYPVSTFHEFISAIYISSEMHLLPEKPLFISVIAAYSE